MKKQLENLFLKWMPFPITGLGFNGTCGDVTALFLAEAVFNNIKDFVDLNTERELQDRCAKWNVNRHETVASFLWHHKPAITDIMLAEAYG